MAPPKDSDVVHQLPSRPPQNGRSRHRWLIALALPGVLGVLAPGRASAQSAAREQVVGVEMPVDVASPAEVMDVGRQAAMPTTPDLPLEEPIDPKEFICGSGDSFELRFWGKQNLVVRMTVDLDGHTFIPKIGKIAVAGKTLAAARTAVLEIVGRHYPGLQSDLTLIKPRDFVVHIAGRVKRPGVHRANPRMRLSSLLGHAGATGSTRRIAIRHRDGSTGKADLLLYARTGDTRHNPYLLDGDVLDIPDAEVEVEIAGPVRVPGRYELIATRDLAELLELAGGLKSSASRTLPIRVTRRSSDERRSMISVPFEAGRAPNLALQDDDLIAVPSTSELDRSVSLVGAVVGADPADPATTIKRLTYADGDTVRSLIERAGGVTVAADLENAYIKRDGQALETIDLERLLVRRDFAADRPVTVGDTIVVPFKRRSVLVEGAVVRAGTFQFNPRFGVREYVESAGGATRFARSSGDIRVIGADGRGRRYAPGVVVQPGDTIVVPERNFSRSEVVQLVMSGAGLVLSSVALGYALTR
jgi:polysaccharide biosynthesis/export protein